MPTAHAQHEIAAPSSCLLDDLVAIDPITSLGALHRVTEHGHPVLHDVVLPAWHPSLHQTQLADVQGEPAIDRIDRFATHALAIDRLRALELVHLASAVLVLGFSSETSRTALDGLFTATDPTEGSSADADPDPQSADPQSFCNHAEFVLTTADETAITASLDSRTGLARKHIGHALTAYIGTPLLLRSILEGRLRFNRWESFIRQIGRASCRERV